MDMIMDGHNFGLKMDSWMDVWTNGLYQIRYTPHVPEIKALFGLLFWTCPYQWTNYGLYYGLFMDYVMD